MSVETITDTRQYLTFTLDNENYAVDVKKVREVLEVPDITRVPRMPKYMRGVINLRGAVVPVIDFRLKFGMDEGEQTVDTSIIIMEVEIGEEELMVGAFADSVQEVIELKPDDIDPPPRIGTKLDTEFIHGIGKVNDDFLILLNIDRIFSQQEIMNLQTDKSAVAAAEKAKEE